MPRSSKKMSFCAANVDALVRQLFGAQSEKLDPAAINLPLAGGSGRARPGKESGPEVPEADPPRPTKLPRAPGANPTPRLPEHLPVIEEVIEPEPVKACPRSSGGALARKSASGSTYEPAALFRGGAWCGRKYVQRAAARCRPGRGALAGVAPGARDRRTPVCWRMWW